MIKIITIVILKLLFALRCALFFIIIICKVQYKPIIIHSEKIMNIVSVLGWFPKETVKAFAFSPFAVLRFQKHEMNANWVNYETIHHYQIIETAWLVLLYSKLEYRYAKYMLWYDHMQSYLYQTTEQEAYLNQENSDYLKSRPIFGFRKYMKQKTQFELINFRVVLK